MNMHIFIFIVIYVGVYVVKINIFQVGKSLRVLFLYPKQKSLVESLFRHMGEEKLRLDKLLI